MKNNNQHIIKIFNKNGVLTNNISSLALNFISPSRRSKKLWSRDHIILSSWIGSKVKVHNGRQAFSILITPEMCGYKLGEFVYTRSDKKLKKKGRKIKK